MHDWLIVGAGFAGSVLAERIARERNETVLIIDKRPHIAGNAYDAPNAAGILVHAYGPHIFHTNAARIFAYLSRFTSWRPYAHRVLASVRGKLVPIPINLDTVNSLYGLDLDEAGVEAFFEARRETIPEPKTSEDVIVSRVGRELYELFFRGYTRKQWGLDPSELDKSVTARVPIRTNRDDLYFNDKFMALPRDGYTRLFERMLDHDNISIALGTSFEDVKRERGAFRRIIYTGAVDAFFDYALGHLPYRSLRFEQTTHEYEWHQPVGVVNYPGSEPFTRITEWKHMTGQIHPKTTITHEYPSAEGDPYYPIPKPETQALYRRDRKSVV